MIGARRDKVKVPICRHNDTDTLEAFDGYEQDVDDINYNIK